MGGLYIRLQVYSYFVKICCSPANFAIQTALLNTIGEIEILQNIYRFLLISSWKVLSELCSKYPIHERVHGCLKLTFAKQCFSLIIRDFCPQIMLTWRALPRFWSVVLVIWHFPEMIALSPSLWLAHPINNILSHNMNE